MDSKGTRALVLWDIDHTLIENGGASKATYALAFELLTGRPCSAPAVTEGRTDALIMSELLTRSGHTDDRITLWQILDALTEAGLRNEKRLRAQGQALPGAADCLRRLAADARVIQSTLTGNIEANARIKLRAFGLDPGIDFSVGAYGVLHDRALLVRVAQQRAASRYQFDPRSQATVLIGDTPADVEAGLLGGARVLAVATGAYSAAQLSAAGADAVVPSLADVRDVERQLHEVIDQGPPGVRSGDPSAEPADRTEPPDIPAGIWWARSIAAHFLDIPGLRARRWLHVQAVAGKAQSVAAALGPDGCKLVQAAWLHDIGYSPTLVRTGFHPLDAADFLKSAGVDDALTCLVAHHTGAVYEASERGLRQDLMVGYRDEVDAVRDALWACDLTTGPGGTPLTLGDRLQEITTRYGPDHVVTRAVAAARPEFEAAVDRTRQLLRSVGVHINL